MVPVVSIQPGEMLLTRTLPARLKAVLIKELQDVEASECWETEKARIDSNNDLLDAFITAKKIEGCSDKTLRYYRCTIERFLCQASRFFPSSE